MVFEPKQNTWWSISRFVFAYRLTSAIDTISRVASVASASEAQENGSTQSIGATVIQRRVGTEILGWDNIKEEEGVD